MSTDIHRSHRPVGTEHPHVTFAAAAAAVEFAPQQKVLRTRAFRVACSIRKCAPKFKKDIHTNRCTNNNARNITKKNARPPKRLQKILAPQLLNSRH